MPSSTSCTARGSQRRLRGAGRLGSSRDRVQRPAASLEAAAVHHETISMFAWAWIETQRESHRLARMAVSREPTGIGVITPEERRRQLRRAVVAGTVGTAIEWYDFFLYSTVTGLVFARLYFPRADPLVGTLEAFGIYAVGFLARPVGAAIFGHYGDRLGRKAALIATLLLMGIATFLVALVPTYQQIGIWGAVLLTVLRFIQGIGVGGEWGGSV